MEEQEEQKTSRFNSQIFILQRIHQLWLDCSKHSRRGELINWSKDLDRIWCELSADASAQEIITFWEYFAKIEECYFEDKEEPGKFKVDQQKLYPLLLQKEMFMRKVQNKQGKGESYNEGDDAYMT